MFAALLHLSYHDYIISIYENEASEHNQHRHNPNRFVRFGLSIAEWFGTRDLSIEIKILYPLKFIISIRLYWTQRSDTVTRSTAIYNKAETTAAPTMATVAESAEAPLSPSMSAVTGSDSTSGHVSKKAATSIEGGTRMAWMTPLSVETSAMTTVASLTLTPSVVSILTIS